MPPKAPKHNRDLGGALLTVRELAGYLKLNQRTVLKLVGEGAIPGVRLGNQWRFKRELIDVWLDDRMLGVREAAAPRSVSIQSFGFDECVTPEHLVPELRSDTVLAVLGELADRAQQLGLVRDKTWFLGALAERENVLSSAVGHGVAFPHTLGRHPEQVTRPFILLGRSRVGIDFHSPDKRPVFLVFVMGLRYQELHLPWLAQLSTLLQDTVARNALLRARDGQSLYRQLRAFAAR
jgi:PTS system nitrogen regulatory IIA component